MIRHIVPNAYINVLVLIVVIILTAVKAACKSLNKLTKVIIQNSIYRSW